MDITKKLEEKAKREEAFKGLLRHINDLPLVDIKITESLSKKKSDAEDTKCDSPVPCRVCCYFRYPASANCDKKLPYKIN